jgi:hypothetical protein
MNNNKNAMAMVLILLTGLLVSCVSLQDRLMTPEERNSAETVGTVSVTFNATNFLHIIDSGAIKNKALSELRKEASKRYQGNIDIRNIAIGGTASGWNVLWAFFTPFWPVLFNVQKISASGDVVMYNTAAARAGADQQKMTAALENAALTLIDNLPRNSTIAVLSISSPSRSDSEYMVDELEYLLVDSAKFTIVDRRRLDQVRSEQNFQMSGGVDDNSAVSIGNMLGASIVITGTVTSTETTQYINIKALDVKTARIITMVREQY